MWKRAFLRAAVGVIVGLAAATAQAESQPVKVVATFSILGDMVATVGGTRIAVTTLVSPDRDAHTYQPTPSDVRSVGDAAVMVTNGLGLEGWLDRFDALNTAAQGVAQLTEAPVP